MEITPELIANYQFSTSMRGFDVDEVNHFLEAIGNELARSQHQVRKATERIALLESQLAEAKTEASSAAAEADGKRAARALMAAQETADRIEEEARTESTKLLNDTTAHCARLRSDTENEIALARAKFADESTQIKAQISAETETMKAAGIAEVESARTGRISELEGEISSLTNLSGNLQADVTAMEQRINGYRALIESMVTMFRDLLDDEDALYTQPPYELRVAIPPANKRIEHTIVVPEVESSEVVPEAAATPTDGDWERGTWNAHLAAEHATGDEEDQDSGAYPMGLETSEMAIVDLDAAPSPGSEEIPETDPTLAEGFTNPLLAEQAAEAEPGLDADSFSGADEDEPASTNPFDRSDPVESERETELDTAAHESVSLDPFEDAHEDDQMLTDAHEVINIVSSDPRAADEGEANEADEADDPMVSAVAGFDEDLDLAYTAEFDAIGGEEATGALGVVGADGQPVDGADGDGDGDGPPIQRQLQAFAGEVDSFQSSPYVPKQVFAEDAEGDDLVAPPMDLSDEAFGRPFESSAYDTQGFSAIGPAADEFDFQPVDGAFAPAEAADGHGGVEFDDSAFSANYTSGDRYLREIEDAVNRQDEDLGDLDAFLASHPPEDSSPRRRFRRK